jgi:hypothetical protein
MALVPRQIVHIVQRQRPLFVANATQDIEKHEANKDSTKLDKAKVAP